DLRDTDIPHRTKTWELILEAWLDHLMRLKRDLKVQPSEISFTADIWSSGSLDPYLAITAHWVGQEE
ncbi:hypothetical protein OG21DRAFT_1379316, partial [Imleria badia]